MNDAFRRARDLGITYRQLDHWVRAGYLHPEGGDGSGHARDWPPTEMYVARDMGLLVKAGLTPKVAHRVARRQGTAAVLAVLKERAA